MACLLLPLRLSLPLPMTTLTPPGLSVPEKTSAPGFSAEFSASPDQSSVTLTASFLPRRGAKASLGPGVMNMACRSERSCFGQSAEWSGWLRGASHQGGPLASPTSGLDTPQKSVTLTQGCPSACPPYCLRECVLEERRANC